MGRLPEILIVDDKQHNLFALERLLKDARAQVVKASSGDEALALALNHNFALAILDVQMPEMDGYELAELLLGNPSTSAVPIIFVSAAYGDDAHRFQGYETGAVDYLVKPLDPSILLGKVSVFLELARTKGELQEILQERTTALERKGVQLARRKSFKGLLGRISRDVNRRNPAETRGAVASAINHVRALIGAGKGLIVCGRDFGCTHPCSGCQAADVDGVHVDNDPGPRMVELQSLAADGGALLTASELPALLVEELQRIVRLDQIGSVLVLPVVEDGETKGAFCFVWPADAPAVEDLPELLALLPELLYGAIQRADANMERERLLHIEAESRAKSRFLASMSHELRTPMNAMLGYTQLLLREPGLTDRQREHLQTIDRSGEHLLTLVNNVLDMARIESGKETVDLTPVNLQDLVRETERLFRLRAAERRLNFRREELNPSPGFVKIDAVKVRQVLINLLGNALKFTAAGEVRLRTSSARIDSSRALLCFEVEDTGIGIPPDRLTDVFEPFVQVSRSATAVGTGVGLAVSRRFARLMGGDVTVNSVLGRGSTFRFAFEAEVLSEDAPADAGLERVVGLVPGSRPVRVLIVEDDPDNRAMLTQMVRSVGLCAREVESVPAALHAFTQESFDIVLTDMEMPDANGLDLMDRLRELGGHHDVPLVVVTASTMKGERERVLAAGADGFVSKPIRERAIFDEIARLTGIEFVVAGATVDPPPIVPFDAQALAAVPLPLREALFARLEEGYSDGIQSVIDDIALEFPWVGRELRRLTDGFEYTTLFELLRGA